LQPIEKNDDKDWMFIKFTEYNGPRNRLAVMKVENRTAGAEQAQDSGGIYFGNATEVPLPAIEELITTALVNTNRFDITERKRIQTALLEQDFGNSSRVSATTTAKLGKVLGAEYLLIAAVNEWTPNKSSTGATGGLGSVLHGTAGKFLGGLGANKALAEVAMSFRVIDSTSGQAIFSTTERATAGSWGFSLAGFGPLSGLSKNSNAPISYAVQSCINKAAYKVAMSLKSHAWKGTIVKVEGGKVYINAGSNKGIQVGMNLIALAKGEALIDPDTQLPLDEDSEAIGNLTVTTVKDNFSIATIVQGCKGLKAGDRVEVASKGP
jgi:curli biogenesis system outer membrane secretion channel CsgG